MTELQAVELLELGADLLEVAERIEFFTHCAAFGIAWIAGLFTWKGIVYGKNHKDLW